MKYLCLRYVDTRIWDAMSECDHKLLREKCAAFDEALRQRGHAIEADTLQDVRSAITLRMEEGKVSVIEGPVAVTGDRLSEIVRLKAEDLNHAIQLMSRYPGMRRGGCLEIRPISECPPTVQGSSL